MRRLTLVIALVLGTPALADETEGEILAYDRLANLIVMRDRTVWQLGAEVTVPADLKSGDRVRLVFRAAGEDGVTGVDSLERIEG